MERETGIEPALVAWKATVLPLNYSRSGYFSSFKPPAALSSPAGFLQIRMKEWIYSGHPCPPGPALRAVQNRSCDFVEPPSVLLIHRRLFKISWWREVDSNHRRHEPADLQSAPVGRLGIPPKLLETSVSIGVSNALLQSEKNKNGNATQRIGQPLTEPPIFGRASPPCQGGLLTIRTRARSKATPGGPRRDSARFPARCSCRVP